MKRLLSAAFLTAAAIGTPVQAQGQQALVRVSYRDLDLTTDAGRAVLTRRINHAVHLTCDQQVRINVLVRPATRRCIRTMARDVNERAEQVIARAQSTKAQLTAR